MPAHYAPIPSAQYSTLDAERELDDAFEDDEDEQLESTPLTRTHDQSPVTHRPTPTPGTYDFERDYDQPPPGSPPGPSALALPGNNWGNSNGMIPEEPVRQSFPRPSFFRRALGNILPTHYAPLPTDSNSGIRAGSGMENDGVFANVTAKPTRARTITTDTGEVHVVPEDSARDAPPTYADAQADTVPPYWETTVHAPDGGDILVDDLPTGTVFVFAANIFTSFFFQFVGFVLTYLLHTSHAAKFGSRAGLGLTLIQYGFYSHSVDVAGSADGSDGLDPFGWPPAEPSPSDPPLHSTAPIPSDPASGPPDTMLMGVSSREWLSFLFMTIGWFLLLSSVIGYWRVKRWEQHIRFSQNRTSSGAEDVNNDAAIRRNIQEVFGLTAPADSPGRPQVIPSRVELQHQRLTEDLRASGLL
ncbi:hypothetical protein FIBSPDRAFT_849318 [Athelia psychrophila]|uniref:Metal homeostatis protein bsd2 n=1 Tax=Athelia psychrophila TaxID=1759441 RepID=A0A166ULF4_9AGAM|nr:hypothetical protein FIBSPDRAFT_849318 [Fibularhizoctonia sp. CBS 109695]